MEKKMRKNNRAGSLLRMAAATLLLWTAVHTVFVYPVSAAAKIADGDTVQVTRDQAITHSTKTKDNIPNSAFYPLPKGTLDTVVGKRISFKKNGKTYYYYNLKSGMRISADDIKVVDKPAPSNNTISDLRVRTDEDFTYILLSTEQRVAYRVKYATDCISFTFSNTKKTPGNESFQDGGFFSRTEWDGGKLTLYFSEKDTFMGYKAYYNKSGDLVLRFNPLPTSIKQCRVAIDPGHGGKDKGAIGSNASFHEKDINLAIAKLLREELEDRGATVLLLDSAGHQGQERKEMAQDWDADILVSIHCNASTNTSATGTEVYYFQVFNKSLANTAAKEVSSHLKTDNRGGRKSYYHVTLSSQMRSVLVETGFMTNKKEYKKLIREDYQQEIAAGIADSIEKSLH